MSLLAELVDKIDSGVNWITLSVSEELETFVNNLGDLSSMTREYLANKKSELELILNEHMTLLSSSILEVKTFSQTTGTVLSDMINKIKSELGIEHAYLSIRSTYENLKKTIEDSGLMPSDIEKDTLDSLEVEMNKIGKDLSNAEDIWKKFDTTRKVLEADLNSHASEEDPSLGTNNQGSSNETSVKGNETVSPNKVEVQAGANKTPLNDALETMNTYSGTDMIATINIPGKGPIVFGELSQLSYSIFREKVPIRTLGRITPKGYTRGLRTITGVMVFNIFDRSIVYECMEELHKEGYRILMDEMPVFDVTVTMANEFGQKSTMTLYGISTYSEGQMMGIDMLGVQSAYEFYAIDIDPMKRMDDDRTLSGTSTIDKNGSIVRAGDSGEGYYEAARNYSLKQQTSTDTSGKFTFEKGSTELHV